MTELRLVVLAIAILGGLIALEARSSEVVGLATQATPSEGPTLVLPGYTVPVDGVLVVRLGAQGRTSQVVTFAGVEMVHAVSLEATYAATISAEVFYLPVQAGQSGAIVATWAEAGTDAKSMVVATLIGAHELAGTEVETDAGPNLATVEISAPADAVVLSTITIHGNGIPEIADHELDGYPTIPESAFHEMKHLAGHLEPQAAGIPTVGYRNTRPWGWMDYTLVAATFEPAPEPDAAVGIAVGSMALAWRRSRPPQSPPGPEAQRARLHRSQRARRTRRSGRWCEPRRRRSSFLALIHAPHDHDFFPFRRFALASRTIRSATASFLHSATS